MTDPRVCRSRAAVVDATRALLRETGFSGTSIEAIAARSGVAKTTIYRQWNGRNELLLDAFAFAAAHVEFPTTHDLRADLHAGLSMLERELSASDWADLMPAMIEAAERDPGFLALSRAFVESRRQPLKDRVLHAQATGELSPRLDAEAIVSMLAGPLFYQRFVARQVVQPSFITDLVDTVLLGAAPTASLE